MILIIGYGNSLRGDDGVGSFVAHEFARRHLDVEVLTPHQLLPELVEPIGRADCVIFIDAGIDGQPGAITCCPVEPHSDAVLFSHITTPAGLLAGAGELFGHTPDTWLITITGQDFDFGEQFSVPVQQAIPSVLKLLQDIIFHTA